MGRLVEPKVFLLGYTDVNLDGLTSYLEYIDALDFWQSITAALAEGVSYGEILCSLYAKLCYKSLVLGQNVNITKVRDIPDNLVACFKSGHGSVFEHCSLNFVITDCSRVFTHELVRHRVGTAFSQTSGRYTRLDNIDLVFDPILEPAKELIENAVGYIEDQIYLIECQLGLRVPPAAYPNSIPADCLLGEVDEYSHYRWVPNDKMNFDKKKALTSAVRRIAPNGQSNEIGLTLNIRSLRQMVQLRTGRHAEWEIRKVFSDIYKIVKERFPLMFYGAKEEDINGALEITGMKLQPFELSITEAVKLCTTAELRAELEVRGGG